MSDDFIKVPMEVTGVQQATKLVEKLGKQLIAAGGDADKIAAAFTQAGENLTIALKQLTKFQKTLAQVQQGSLQQRVDKTNPDVQNRLKAEKLVYQEAIRLNKQAIIDQQRADTERLRQKRADSMAAFKGIAQDEARLARQADALTTRRQADLSKATRQARKADILAAFKEDEAQQRSYQKRQAELQRVFDQDTLKQRLRIQKEAAKTAPLTLQQKAQQSRDFAVERAIGDGGASLFKIQASLLLNYTLMNQLFNLFQYGTQFVLQFDKTIKDLQATIASTDTEMLGLSQTIIEVSKNTRFSAVEVAEGAIILGQAGFSAKQIGESLQGVVLLATATGSDLATSVDVASSVISVFNLRAEDMDHVANVLTGSINLTKLTIDKLAQGIQYAGNIAADAGLTFEETTAILGAMSNAGIRAGSTLGTGLRQILTELLNPSEKFQKVLQRIGLTAQDVDIQSKGFVGVMNTLRDAGFSTANAFEAFEVRSAAAFAAIQKNPELINTLRESFLYTNAAAKANEVQMGSLANILLKLANNFGILINKMSGPFLDSLKVLANALADVIGWIADWNTNLLKLSGAIVTGLGLSVITLSLTRFVKGLMAARVAVVGMTAATEGLAVAGAAATAASGGFLIPLLALTAVFATLIGVVSFASDGFDNLAQNVDKSKAALDEAQGVYASTNESIGSVEQNIARLDSRFAQLKESPSEVYTEMVSLQQQFGSLGLKIKNETEPSIEDLIDALRELRKEMAQTSLEQLQQTLSGRARLFQAQATQFRAESQKQVNIDRELSQYSDSPNEKNPLIQTSYRNTLNEANLQAQLSKLPNLGNLGQGQLIAIKQQAQAILNSVYKNQGDVNNELVRLQAVVNNGGKADKAFVMDLEYRQEVTTGIISRLNTILETTTGYLVGAKEEMSKAFETTTLFQTLQERISVFNETVSQLQKKYANAPQGSQAAIDAEKELKTYIEKFQADMLQLVTDNTGTALYQLQRMLGMSVTEADVNTQIEGMKANINGAVHVAQDHLAEQTKTTINAINPVVEASKNFLAEVERSYSHVTDELDRAAKNIDNVTSESLDLDRGGLRGKYSDAELYALANKKKDLETQAIKARLDALPGVIAAVENLARSQGGIVGEKGRALNSKDPATKTEYISAQKEVNDTLEKRTALIKELNDLQDQYNARMGIETEAHMTLTEQIKSTISSYRESMSIQSQWSYNIRENIIGVLDDSRTAFGDFVGDVARGTKTVGQGFRDMAVTILESMLKITANKFGGQLLDTVMGLGGQALGSLWGGGQTFDTNTNAGIGSYLDATAGLYTGGPVRAATGMDVGRDNQLILARQGEYVLRNSAVDAIGRDNLNRINAMGNRRISQPLMDSIPQVGNSGGTPSIVNVYVVSPEQKPTLTKQDVLVTIAEDMSRGGQTKKLVKSIIAGG